MEKSVPRAGSTAAMACFGDSVAGMEDVVRIQGVVKECLFSHGHVTTMPV